MKLAKLAPAAAAASIAAMVLAAPAASAAPKAPATASKASQISLKANKPSETTDKKGITWLHATASYRTPSKTRITKVCVRLNIAKRSTNCGRVYSSSVGGVSSFAVKCGKKGTYYVGVWSVAWAVNKYGDQIGDKVSSKAYVYKC
jgi:hypothetical protein